MAVFFSGSAKIGQSLTWRRFSCLRRWEFAPGCLGRVLQKSPFLTEKGFFEALFLPRAALGISRLKGPPYDPDCPWPGTPPPRPPPYPLTRTPRRPAPRGPQACPRLEAENIKPICPAKPAPHRGGITKGGEPPFVQRTCCHFLAIQSSPTKDGQKVAAPGMGPRCQELLINQFYYLHTVFMRANYLSRKTRRASAYLRITENSVRRFTCRPSGLSLPLSFSGAIGQHLPYPWEVRRAGSIPLLIR